MFLSQQKSSRVSASLWISLIKWMGDWVIKCVKIYKSSNHSQTTPPNQKRSETKSHLILNTHSDTCQNFPALFILVSGWQEETHVSEGEMFRFISVFIRLDSQNCDLRLLKDGKEESIMTLSKSWNVFSLVTCWTMCIAAQCWCDKRKTTASFRFHWCHKSVAGKDRLPIAQFPINSHRQSSLCLTTVEEAVKSN